MGLSVGLLGLIFGILAIVVHGHAISVRYHGARVTATVTSCEGVSWHNKYGDRHRTDCAGEWALPGRTTSTGEIDGAAQAISAYAEGESDIDVHEQVEVWATDTEALVVQKDPAGWLWGGTVLAGFGAVVLAVTAWRRHRDY